MAVLALQQKENIFFETKVLLNDGQPLADKKAAIARVKDTFRKVTQMLLTLREKYTKLGSHKSLIGICVKRLDRVKTNSH